MKSMKSMIGTRMKMKILKSKTIRMLQFSGLSGDCNISHFITTREGGVSRGHYAALNPSEYSGDDAEAVRRNRLLIAEAIGIIPEKLLTPYQVHGDEVRVIDALFSSLTSEKQRAYLQGVDALVTAIPGFCVAVATADCVPILLYAADRKVVAAVHAGWRGTVQRIVEKTVRCMTDQFACDPACIKAGIAPSIGKDAFEVGEEVVEAFKKAGMDLSRIMERHVETGKAHIDLWEANRIQLLEAGLSASQVEVAGICTYTHFEDFFSARRLGIESGRILSGIVIKE